MSDLPQTYGLPRFAGSLDSSPGLWNSFSGNCSSSPAQLVQWIFSLFANNKHINNLRTVIVVAFSACLGLESSFPLAGVPSFRRGKECHLSADLRRGHASFLTTEGRDHFIPREEDPFRPRKGSLLPRKDGLTSFAGSGCKLD